MWLFHIGLKSQNTSNSFVNVHHPLQACSAPPLPSPTHTQTPFSSMLAPKPETHSINTSNTFRIFCPEYHGHKPQLLMSLLILPSLPHATTQQSCRF